MQQPSLLPALNASPPARRSWNYSWAGCERGSRKRRRPNSRASVYVADATLSDHKHVRPFSEFEDLKIHRLNEETLELPAVPTTPAEPGRQSQFEMDGTPLGCPVYVMLPLDTVRVNERSGASELKKERELAKALGKFKKAGVTGIMVDVWWGIVERDRPRHYDLMAYRRLFSLVSDAGLKIQAVMSFHAAGGNVGDTCEIPLPSWVLDIGNDNPDIFYTDRQGFRNRECLSLGCDNECLFWSRSPVQMYQDFVDVFVAEFQDICGNVITEITVGLGPAGELRYPSYPEGDGRWCFPGVGEFQCYDKYMLKQLHDAAIAAGHPECGMLIEHAERILSAVSEVLESRGQPQICRSMTMVGDAPSLPARIARILVGIGQTFSAWWPFLRSQMTDGSSLYSIEPALCLGVKCAGVHWWFKTRAHPAELTAGYYNTHNRDGYGPIMDVLKKYNAHMSFTCVEMRDCEHPPESMCSPQGLLQQIIDTSLAKDLAISGENALQRYDEYAFSRITESAFGLNARAGRLQQVTFLRMGCVMFDNWVAFSSFLQKMKFPPQ